MNSNRYFSLIQTAIQEVTSLKTNRGHLFQQPIGLRVQLAIFTMLTLFFILNPVSLYANCIQPTALWLLDETDIDPDFKDAINPAQNYGICTICPEPIEGRFGMGRKFFNYENKTGITVAANGIFNWDAKDSFSISFWMKRDNSPFEREPDSDKLINEVIVGRDSTDDNNNLHWWIGVGATGGSTRAVFIDKSGAPHNGTTKYMTGDKLLTDNRWHFIVFVRDAHALENRLYVDGVLEDKKKFTYTMPDAFSDQSTQMDIGWINMRWSQYHYKGILDEVALYDKALPTWFIRDRYHAKERYQGDNVEDPCRE